MNARSPLSLPAMALACVLLSGLFGTPTRGQAPPHQPLSGPPGPPQKMEAPSPAVRKAMQQWQTALKLQQAKKFPEAIAAYREFLVRAQEANLPASAAAPAYQNLTAIYRQTDKTAELEDSLKHLSALTPDNAAVHAELSSLYASPKIKQFDEAAKEARKALALKPISTVAAGAHVVLGIVGVAKKDYAMAEQEFGIAIKLSPGNAQMEYNYGLALAERKKYPQALAVMQKVAAHNPRMAGAWYYIGILSETQQRYPQSIDALQKAIYLAPRDPNIQFDLARVELRSNNIDAAITAYLIALELAPQNLPARIAVAQLYVQLHNYPAGRVHYAQAAKLAPKNALVLAGLAECESELTYQPQDAAARAALVKQAEEHFRAASAIDSNYLVGPTSLAHFYERTGMFDKAREIYRKRMEADPKDYSNYNQLAQTYLMERKPDDAIAIWRKFLDQHPDNPNPYARIAETLQSQGKWSDAAAEWQLLLKQKLQAGAAAGVMVSIGKDLANANKNKEAIEQLEAVLKVDTSAGDTPKEVRVAAIATIRAERLEAMQELARISEQDNKIDEAIRWQQQIKTEEAVNAEKNHGSPNPDSYLALARLYQRAKKPDLAIKELDALTQTRQPRRENFAPAYEQLAQVYESLNRFDDAIQAYRSSAKYSKEPLNGRIRAAEVYQRSNRLPLAIAEFEAIKTDFPREMRVLTPLALAYRQAGRDEDALRIYDALLKDDPQASWARDQKAVVLTHMKRYDQARAIYEDQLVHNPQNRQLYADVAFVFQSEGKPDAFLDWVLPRLEKAPANVTLMSVVLDETIRQKKEDQGWALLRANHEKHKEQRAITEATAVLMTQHGRREDALALIREIAAQNPKDLNAQLTLADQLSAAGHKDDAAKLYTGLIARTDLGPTEKLSVRRQLATFDVQQGNATEALAQLREIVQADPNDFDSATKLSLQLEAAGRDEEAIPLLQTLASREVYAPTVRGQIRSKLGRLYLKKGDKVAATAEFRKALDLNPRDTASQVALSQLGAK